MHMCAYAKFLRLDYVASGMKNDFSNYYPEGNWYNTPWATLENENRIKIVEKQTVQVYSVNRER